MRAITHFVITSVSTTGKPGRRQQFRLRYACNKHAKITPQLICLQYTIYNPLCVKSDLCKLLHILKVSSLKEKVVSEG